MEGNTGISANVKGIWGPGGPGHTPRTQSEDGGLPSMTPTSRPADQGGAPAGTVPLNKQSAMHPATDGADHVLQFLRNAPS